MEYAEFRRAEVIARDAAARVLSSPVRGEDEANAARLADLLAREAEAGEEVRRAAVRLAAGMVAGARYAHPDAGGEEQARHVRTADPLTGRCPGPCLGRGF